MEIICCRDIKTKQNKTELQYHLDMISVFVLLTLLPCVYYLTFLSYNSSFVKWENNTSFLGLFDVMLHVKIPETKSKLLAY